jgi:1-acyl-sn-glycerol-3-phosphate acyltransferase
LRLLYAFIKAFWILFVQIPRLDRASQSLAIQKWSADTLKLLGISVEVIGNIDASTSNASRLLVANHISWLDPLVIQTLQHSIFVAKQEVSRWPVVGHIAKGCDVVFVNRGFSQFCAHDGAKHDGCFAKGICASQDSPEGTRVLKATSWTLPFQFV